MSNQRKLINLKIETIMTNEELLNRINKCGRAIDASYKDAVRISEIESTELVDGVDGTELITAWAEYSGGEMYVAMIYYQSSDLAFMPTDWQGAWSNEPMKPSQIKEADWVDEDGRPATMLSGLPHKFTICCYLSPYLSSVLLTVNNTKERIDNNQQFNAGPSA
jgi:hypothetical protein